MSTSAGIGNPSLVTDQIQTLQGMAGCTNFPPTIPFLFVRLLSRFSSWRKPKLTHSTFIAQCGFSLVPHTYAIHEVARRADFI